LARAHLCLGFCFPAPHSRHHLDLLNPFEVKCSVLSTVSPRALVPRSCGKSFGWGAGRGARLGLARRAALCAPTFPPPGPCVGAACTRVQVPRVPWPLFALGAGSPLARRIPAPCAPRCAPPGARPRVPPGPLRAPLPERARPAAPPFGSCRGTGASRSPPPAISRHPAPHVPLPPPAAAFLPAGQMQAAVLPEEIRWLLEGNALAQPQVPRPDSSGGPSRAGLKAGGDTRASEGQNVFPAPSFTFFQNLEASRVQSPLPHHTHHVCLPSSHSRVPVTPLSSTLSFSSRCLHLSKSPPRSLSSSRLSSWSLLPPCLVFNLCLSP
jgi:hypothetical protein